MRQEWGDQIVACTATASAAHGDDIATCLSMSEHLTIRMPSKKTNLRIAVVPKGEQRRRSEQNLIRMLRESTAKRALVFCGTRSECEAISTLLQKNDLKSAAYHAGLDNRASLSEQFQTGECPCLCSSWLHFVGKQQRCYVVTCVVTYRTEVSNRCVSMYVHAGML
jgi:superfamily II DNA helicase RecQ